MNEDIANLSNEIIYNKSMTFGSDKIAKNRLKLKFNDSMYKINLLTFL